MLGRLLGWVRREAAEGGLGKQWAGREYKAIGSGVDSWLATEGKRVSGPRGSSILMWGTGGTVSGAVSEATVLKWRE